MPKVLWPLEGSRTPGTPEPMGQQHNQVNCSLSQLGFWLFLVEKSGLAAISEASRQPEEAGYSD